MLIPPKYTINSRIIALLQEIEQTKTKLNESGESDTRLQYRRQQSLLKSSVYSARIEGNPNLLSEVSLEELQDPKEVSKIELANIYRAIEAVLNRSWPHSISIQDIKDIHRQVLNSLSADAGHVRSEQSAIFNQAGVAIYVTPIPQEINSLLEQLLDFINSNQEPTALIKAVVTHFAFEKIHPFMDGNGRVGRVLMHLILRKFNYDLAGRSAFEVYIDQNKADYYHYLNSSPKNITLFVEFMLSAILEGLKAELTDVKSHKKRENSIEDNLPHRRLEILQIIREHKSVSFDFIKRRFMAVSDRMIRFDLKQLQDLHLIQKRGTTRGAVYEAKYLQGPSL